MSKVSTTNAIDYKKGPILLVLLLGAFVAILNQTVMNVALPSIITDLKVTTNTAQWLTTGYMLVNGVLIPVTAFLIERYTTRQLFITAMGLFSVGTIICGFSHDFTFLLLGRVVQAAGAGIIMPLLTSVVFTIFPLEKRGSAMGLIGIAMVFAPAVGPTLSGYIIEQYEWRTVFDVVIPIAVIDFILAIFLLKNVTKQTFPKIDLLSIVWSTLGFGGILYGFSAAGNDGWNSKEVYISFTVGILALLTFIIVQLRAARPMLEFRVYKSFTFSLTTGINVLLTMAMFSGMILLPLYLQGIRGFSPFKSGLLLLPGAILMGIMSPITGWIFDKIGARMLAIIGLLITLFTNWEFTKLEVDTSYTFLMVIYTLRMFGMSMLMMPILTAGLNSLPSRLTAHGNAMANTIRALAGAMGTSLLVTVMTSRQKVHGDNLVAAHAKDLATNPGYAAILKQKAAVEGLNDAFVVATIMIVLALILSFFIKHTKPAEQANVQEAVDLKKVVSESK